MQIVGRGDSLPSCCEMADLWGTDFSSCFRGIGDIRPTGRSKCRPRLMALYTHDLNQVSGGYWADSRWRGRTTPSCPTWHVAGYPPCSAAIFWAVLGGMDVFFFPGQPGEASAAIPVISPYLAVCVSSILHTNHRLFLTLITILLVPLCPLSEFTYVSYIIREYGSNELTICPLLTRVIVWLV